MSAMEGGAAGSKDEPGTVVAINEGSASDDNKSVLKQPSAVALQAAVASQGSALTLIRERKLIGEGHGIPPRVPSPVKGLGVDDNATEDGSEDGDEGDEPDLDPLEPVRGEVRCVPSLFPHKVPGIYFDYPELLRELGIVRDEQGAGADFYVEELGNRKIFYKCNWERNCIKNAFTRAGFRRKISGVQWNCAWSKHLSTEGFENLNRFQKVNHFPGSWCIGRKDRLMRCIGRAKRAAGKMPNVPQNAFDIVPGGWILPTEYDSFMRNVSQERNPVYILKPSASACGRGIRLIHKNNMNTVPTEKPCIVQEYLKDPYLINGKKFDLRIYVLVTSFDPLRAYVFQEGLCRFSTHNYSMKKLNSRFAHLTNYSVNKKSKHFVAPTSDNNSDMEGSKWSLTALWRYLMQAEGKGTVKRCQNEVKRLITKTLIAAEGEIAPLVHRHLKSPGCCYELFGFDVFLDKALRPWLIEVNISPSLMGSSPLDQKIKGTLMADVFHLIGNVPYDDKAIKSDNLKERLMRRAGTYRSKTTSKRSNQDLWRVNPTHPGTVNFHDLSDEDWELIFDAEDEYSRKGHFTRLFPSEENIDLLNYFQSPRFNNCMMMAWLLYGRPSYVKNAHILAEADDEEKVFDSLVKVADRANRGGKGGGPRVGKSRARPQFDLRVGGGGGGGANTGAGGRRGSNLAEAETAHPIVLVPGYNCAAARCALPSLEADVSSTWLIPLGSRSDEQIKNESEALKECVSGPAAEDVEEEGSMASGISNTSGGSSGGGSNAENNKDVKNVAGGRGGEKKVAKGAGGGGEGGRRSSNSGSGFAVPERRQSVSARSSVRRREGMGGGGGGGRRIPRKSRGTKEHKLKDNPAKEGQDYEDIFAEAKRLIADQLADIGAGGVGIQKRGPKVSVPANLVGLETTLFAAQKAFNFEQALAKQKGAGRG
ncbi:hypothetical protein TrRE_jg1675 [Triparma retinervis]|uniref:Tubulin--tyrosine ligase-like protein 5 n=1 Tax=Triparma retinervis TaxID=2557542 RepID=A0A9W7DZV8_9STRA|nr:hypothetical protein TrRE_jg1675 [Triparma retinervis]